jgi:hypothetical protein
MLSDALISHPRIPKIRFVIVSWFVPRLVIKASATEYHRPWALKVISYRYLREW